MPIFHDAAVLWRKARRERSTSLHLRLFAFFALFLVAVVSGFLLLLLACGVFDSAGKESRLWMERELDSVAAEIAQDYGKLSVQGLSYAEQLTADAEVFLQKNECRGAELAARPELLEGLLTAQMPTLLSALSHSECSGAFVLLNATVNPALENAETSRAGVFIKRTEPNAINLIGSKIHYLRGPASIARSYGVELLGQWQMEFDTDYLPFLEDYFETLQDHSGLPLSRLYYWSGRILMKDNSESAMLLCFPLIARDGSVYGMCGLEVSSMLFKLRYSPDNSRYPRIFSILSPLEDDLPDTVAGLLAGNSYLTNPQLGQFLFVRKEAAGLTLFSAMQADSYVGLSRAVNLYPAGSPFEGESWAVSVLMPFTDFRDALQASRATLYGGIAGVLLLSILLAALVSRRTIRPVVNAIERLKTSSRTELPKTKIAEIDDLIEFLSAQDKARDALESELARTKQAAGAGAEAAPDLTAYAEFVQNIGTLSAAERAVFELYMEGYTAREIADKLYLSINTIKTHNKRIYMKLNVTSRKELMVYVQMMAREPGKEESRG